MHIRLAVPEDALAVAHVHVRSWQAAYRGLLPAEYLSQLCPEDRAAAYEFQNDDLAKPYTQVAVVNGGVAGFATTMPARDQDCAGFGELCALYVAPEHWGFGIGVALAAAARTHLEVSGFSKALLWVLSGNSRAERFYVRDGWLPDGTSRTDTVWGIAVDELRYRRALVPDRSMIAR